VLSRSRESHESCWGNPHYLLMNQIVSKRSAPAVRAGHVARRARAAVPRRPAAEPSSDVAGSAQQRTRTPGLRSEVGTRGSTTELRPAELTSTSSAAPGGRKGRPRLLAPRVNLGSVGVRPRCGCGDGTNWTGRDGRQAATRRGAGGGKGAGGARARGAAAPDEGAGGIAA